MVKIEEFAKAYESKTTKNISELTEISTNLDLQDDEFDFTDKEGNEKTVKQRVIVVDDQKYRVPISVIQQLKVMIEDNPKITKFKVKKTGEGKDNTRYTVIPIL